MLEFRWGLGLQNLGNTVSGYVKEALGVLFVSSNWFAVS